MDRLIFGYFLVYSTCNAEEGLVFAPHFMGTCCLPLFSVSSSIHECTEACPRLLNQCGHSVELIQGQIKSSTAPAVVSVSILRSPAHRVVSSYFTARRYMVGKHRITAVCMAKKLSALHIQCTCEQCADVLLKHTSLCWSTAVSALIYPYELASLMHLRT